MCDETCIFFFFPIINKYFLMAKRSLLSRCPSYIAIYDLSDSAISLNIITPRLSGGGDDGFSLQILSEIFLNLRRIQEDIIKT